MEKLSPSPAAVNFSKLDHFDGIHIRALSEDALFDRIRPFFINAGYTVDDDLLRKIGAIIQERIRTLEEAVEISGFFFESEVDPNSDELIGKKMSVEETSSALKSALALLQDLPSFESTELEADLRNLAENLGLKAGQLFGILRIAVTGQRVSPPLIESMEIIGKDIVLERISSAIEKLS